MPGRLAAISISCSAILLAAAFAYAICLYAAPNSLLAASQPGQHAPHCLCHTQQCYGPRGQHPVTW